MDSKKPGFIFETNNGEYAIAYHSEQEKQFQDLNKFYVHIYKDSLLQEPVLVEGKPKCVLKSPDKLKLIGFND